MELIDLQNKVRRFIEEKNLNSSPDVRIIDLVSEIGELSKEVLKGTNYGDNPFATTDNWQSEMGDVLFSLICLANQTNVSLENCLLEAIEKYENRFNKNKDVGSGR